ncbi:MAG: hypothetical protein VCB42_01200 [Myxococcota bacterium]
MFHPILWWRTGSFRNLHHRSLRVEDGDTDGLTSPGVLWIALVRSRLGFQRLTRLVNEANAYARLSITGRVGPRAARAEKGFW